MRYKASSELGLANGEPASRITNQDSPNGWSGRIDCLIDW